MTNSSAISFLFFKGLTSATLIKTVFLFKVSVISFLSSTTARFSLGDCEERWATETFHFRSFTREGRKIHSGLPRLRVVPVCGEQEERCNKQREQRSSPVQDDMCVLGNAHMRSIPSLSSFPNAAFETSSNVRLTDGDPLSSFQGRSSSASSFHASLLQAIDSEMFLALCPHVVSQAPQHFRSSETQYSTFRQPSL